MNAERKRARDAAYYATHREERRAKQAAYGAAHREEIRAKNAAYYAAHREEIRERDATYNAAHREERRAKNAAYNAAHREEINAKQVAYRKENPGAIRAKNATRRATMLNQRCACCTDAEIREIHNIAALCGRGAEVDHRTPLALGGLHCAKNLQALTYEEHKEKTRRDLGLIADERRERAATAA